MKFWISPMSMSSYELVDNSITKLQLSACQSSNVSNMLSINPSHLWENARNN
jgi:hypothetical protein